MKRLEKVREQMFQRKEHMGPEVRTGSGYRRTSRKAVKLVQSWGESGGGGVHPARNVRDKSGWAQRAAARSPGLHSESDETSLEGSRLPAG